jgi:hypothetical protein
VCAIQPLAMAVVKATMAISAHGKAIVVILAQRLISTSTASGMYLTTPNQRRVSARQPQSPGTSLFGSIVYKIDAVGADQQSLGMMSRHKHD